MGACFNKKKNNKISVSEKVLNPKEKSLLKPQTPILAEILPNKPAENIATISQQSPKNLNAIPEKKEQPPIKPSEKPKKPLSNPITKTNETQFSRPPEINEINRDQNNEKTFLRGKIPETFLKNLLGHTLIHIKDSGEVMNRYGHTLGYFRDHWVYSDKTKIKGRIVDDYLVQDELGNILGYLPKNGGMVLNKNGLTIGNIQENGIFKDAKFEYKTQCEGEIKRMAMVYYFMHPEIREQIK